MVKTLSNNLLIKYKKKKKCTACFELKENDKDNKKNLFYNRMDCSIHYIIPFIN